MLQAQSINTLAQMELLHKLMQKARETQLNNFKNDIKEFKNKKMSRREFIVIYLMTFFGYCFEKNILDVDDETFSAMAHQIIDEVSLCGEEIDFFHYVVGVDEKSFTIKNLIKQYHQTKNLNRCQLGTNMLKCLQLSKSIIFL